MDRGCFPSSIYPDNGNSEIFLRQNLSVSDGGLFFNFEFVNHFQIFKLEMYFPV